MLLKYAPGDTIYDLEKNDRYYTNFPPKKSHDGYARVFVNFFVLVIFTTIM